MATSASAQGGGRAGGLPLRRPSPSATGGRTRAASTPAPSFATRCASSAPSPPSPSPSRPSTPQRRRPSLPSPSTQDPPSSPRLVPVPRWSLFPPPSLTPVPSSPPPSEPLLRRSLSLHSQSTTSTTGAIVNSYAQLSHEGVTSDEEEDRVTDVFGSPRSVSTFATSMSRSSSAGTSFTSPAMKQGSMLGVAVEEEEEETEGSYVLLPPSSTNLPLPLPSPREEDERRGRRLSWTSRRSKGSTSTKSSGTGTTRVTAVAEVEEASSFWTPPTKVDESARVKTNRATRVDESLVAEILHPTFNGEHLFSPSMTDFNPIASPAPSQSTFGDPHSPPPSSSSFSHHPKSSTSTLSLHLHHPSPSLSSHHPSPSPSQLPLQIPKDKPARQAFERELGTRVLRASGASEREIALRARSVGYQILKEEERKEAEARKEGRVYAGGQELRSQFSWT